MDSAQSLKSMLFKKIEGDSFAARKLVEGKLYVKYGGRDSKYSYIRVTRDML